jgi:hypothetical protein
VVAVSLVKGRVIGHGDGLSRGLAKRNAALEALSTIESGGIQDLL